MRRVNQRFIGIAWFIFVLIFVSSMIAVTFLLTGYIYKIVNWHPPILLTQIINTLLGLLLTGMMVGIVGKFARSRGWSAGNECIFADH